MIKFTLEIGDIIRIGDDVMLYNLAKHAPYQDCKVAKLGIHAPRSVNVSRTNNRKPRLSKYRLLKNHT